MEYRNLGRTGVKVTPLCLGTMTFGARTPLEDACAIVDRALDAEINFIDTANAYSRGKSEEITGEALHRNGKRDKIILATKVYAAMDDKDLNMRGNSRRHIINECEASLRRLKTDYIDLYQVHRPQSDIPIDESLRALDDLIRSGKVRYIGSSTFAAWQCVESLWTSEKLGLNRFICEQPPYNILDRRVERELFPMARTFGYAIIPWSPIGGGLLSGKYTRGEQPPSNTRFEKVSEMEHLQYRYKDAVFDVCDVLKPIAEKHSATIAQVALAWTICNPAVTSSIMGPRTLEQLEDNLGALNIKLDKEDLAAIDAVSPPGGVKVGYYEADFGPHPHRI
ncbi:MAG: aldo/keto reductase [Chthoniobacterales bacterium]